MYYERHECKEHKEFAAKFDQLDKRVDVIHADLKSIKLLLVAVISAILGTGIIL
jgi:hypothetical protein